jgi:hypothetical protein
MIKINSEEEFKFYCSKAFILVFKINITEEEQRELEDITQAIEAWENSIQEDKD